MSERPRRPWPFPLRTWRTAFVAYAIALFTMTHWPKLVVQGPVPRTDLWAHFAAFSLWTVLLGGSFGRGLPLWALALVGFAYAGVDEGLQAIPALGRVCAWDDFFADCGGVVIGVGVLALWRRVTGTPRPRPR